VKSSSFSGIEELGRGMLVKFDGHPRDYLLRFSSCPDPNCPCRDMTCIFSPLDDPDDFEAEFTVTLNIETWQETGTSSRSEPAASRVREFVTGLTDDLKAEFRSKFEKVKKHARRVSEFSLDPVEIENGKLVAYSQVAGDSGSILEGGQNVWMTFPFEGTDYLVEDQYCLNPECRCRKAHLTFLEARPMPGGIKNIRDAFDATMTLNGRAEVGETFAVNAPLARRILEAWRTREDRLSVLRVRYKEMKEVGRRIFAAEVDRLLDEDMPHVPPTPPIRVAPKVGRNEPCPCGSGKKYKKCCGR
jgi:hypothetical protein